VSDFRTGTTPESISDACETVSLADVYAVFAYYPAPRRNAGGHRDDWLGVKPLMKSKAGR
jgi:hypothetical protein